MNFKQLVKVLQTNALMYQEVQGVGSSLADNEILANYTLDPKGKYFWYNMSIQRALETKFYNITYKYGLLNDGFEKLVINSVDNLKHATMIDMLIPQTWKKLAGIKYDDPNDIEFANQFDYNEIIRRYMFTTSKLFVKSLGIDYKGLFLLNDIDDVQKMYIDLYRIVQLKGQEKKYDLNEFIVEGDRYDPYSQANTIMIGIDLGFSLMNWNTIEFITENLKDDYNIFSWFNRVFETSMFLIPLKG